MLTVVRRSAVKARTQAANQMHSLLVGAPEPLKAQLRGMNLKARVRVCARFRPSGESSVSYAKQALRAQAHQPVKSRVPVQVRGEQYFPDSPTRRWQSCSLALDP